MIRYFGIAFVGLVIYLGLLVEVQRLDDATLDQLEQMQAQHPNRERQ